MDEALRYDRRILKWQVKQCSGETRKKGKLTTEPFIMPLITANHAEILHFWCPVKPHPSPTCTLHIFCRPAVLLLIGFSLPIKRLPEHYRCIGANFLAPELRHVLPSFCSFCISNPCWFTKDGKRSALPRIRHKPMDATRTFNFYMFASITANHR